MKRSHLLLPTVAMLLCGGSTSFGQTLIDHFGDGDYTTAPAWSGTSGWTIVANSDVSMGAAGSSTLRLAAAAVAGLDYLSTPVNTWGDAQEWGFWVGRRAQAYTASNQFYLWLYASEATLSSGTVDGYRLAIGDDSGGDEIRLEYVLNGSLSATVITSAQPIPNGLTDIGLLVRVTRSSAGGWEIFTSVLPAANGSGETASAIPNSSNAALSQGTGIHNGLAPAAGGYLGIAVLHSSGANALAAAELDQVYLTTSTSPAAPPVQPVTAGEIRINRFSPDYGLASDEFIELVNTTSRAIDLSALKIVYQSAGGGTGAAGGTLSGIIPAQGFWLLSTNSTVTAGLSSVSRDGAINGGFSTSGQLALQRIADNLRIDGLAYGAVTVNNLGEGTPAPAPPVDGALKRLTDGNDSDANNTDFNTMTNASILVRNSSARFIGQEAVLPSGSYSYLSTSGSASLGGDVTVASLLLNAGSQLALGGHSLTINGAISGTGTLTGSATSTLVIGGPAGNLDFTPGYGTLKQLTLSDNAAASLVSRLDIAAGTSPGVLAIGANATLASNGMLRLLSDAGGTARVGMVAAGGSVTGNVVVERYIPPKRAWRLITAPLSGGESIFDAWQNSGSYTAGVGMLVTGAAANSAVNGLDAGSTSTSMYFYDQAANTWSAITNTRTTQVSAQRGYLAFIRGDRNSSNLAANAAANATTLDAAGLLKTGDQQFLTNSTGNGFTLLGNPYASPVDFDLLYTDAVNAGTPGNTNIQRKFWTWDPAIGDRGGYVTVNYNGSGYDIVPAFGVSAQTRHLQSGQAFFVQSAAAGTAQLTFREAHKSASNINEVFRQGPQSEKMIIHLARRNAGGGIAAIDGVMINFNNSFDPSVTDADAVKLTGFDEYLALKRAGQLLSIEARPLADINDTLYLHLGNLKTREYELSITPSSFNAPGLGAWLMDSHLGTTQALSLTHVNHVVFQATQNTPSAASDRFRIVFRPNTPLPLLFVSLAGRRGAGQIELEWNVTGATGNICFEIEKSADALTYVKRAVLHSDTAGSQKTYRWTDPVVAANNYYRVKAVDAHGHTAYSNAVLLRNDEIMPCASVYPNPVKNREINIKFSGCAADICRLKIVDSYGTTVFSRSLAIPQNENGSRIYLPDRLPAGIYIIIGYDSQGVLFRQQVLID